MSAKKKVTGPQASITMQVNDLHFHAEGDEREVQEKFRKFLDEAFRPTGNFIEAATKAGLVKSKPPP